MTLPPDLIHHSPFWSRSQFPSHPVAVSTRGRYARNVTGLPFAPHAAPPILQRIRDRIGAAMANSPTFNDFYVLEMAQVPGRERGFLKESRLISKEMERGGASRAVYVSHDLGCSLMVNEEDHLRVQYMAPGFDIGWTQPLLDQIHAELESLISFAYHARYGYLTACPTNVGTGLRSSVMLHLPGLTLQQQIEPLLQSLPKQGFTVRGFHGENSQNIGDFFQVSNEVTLGRTVDEINQQLSVLVEDVIRRELEARQLLIEKGGIAVEDMIWRSFGLLSQARKIDSAEAMKLLSRLRLGIGHGLPAHLTHGRLNALVAEIQPGHLMLRHGASDETDERDTARATIVRRALANGPDSAMKL